MPSKGHALPGLRPKRSVRMNKKEQIVKMRIEELIIYKDFAQGNLLHDMVYLMEHYREEKDRELFYDCMHGLLELAASHGFY